MSGYIGHRNDPLLIALKEARDMLADWAAYASDYFQEKHDLKGDLAKLDAVIDKYENPRIDL